MRRKYSSISTVIFSFCCILLLGSNLVRAQFNSNVSKVGTIAASFLEIDVGARAVGMGGAFVAVADDATAIFWNPAGLSRLKSSEAIIIRTNWLVETYFDFAGFVSPLGRWGTVAASITSLSTDEMDVRTVQFQEGTGENSPMVTYP